MSPQNEAVLRADANGFCAKEIRLWMRFGECYQIACYYGFEFVAESRILTIEIFHFCNELLVTMAHSMPASLSSPTNLMASIKGV